MSERGAMARLIENYESGVASRKRDCPSSGLNTRLVNPLTQKYKIKKIEVLHR